jgi:hypothetical protein
MPPKELNAAPNSPGRSALPDTELLLQSVHKNIDAAQEQIERSQAIVARSREIVARVRLALERARRIQNSAAAGSQPKKVVQ